MSAELEDCSVCYEKKLCVYVVSDDPYCGASICPDCVLSACGVTDMEEYREKNEIACKSGQPKEGGEDEFPEVGVEIEVNVPTKGWLRAHLDSPDSDIPKWVFKDSQYARISTWRAPKWREIPKWER